MFFTDSSASFSEKKTRFFRQKLLQPSPMKVYEAGIEQWSEEDLEQGVGYTEASEAPTKHASEMNKKGTSACRIHVGLMYGSPLPA